MSYIPLQRVTEPSILAGAIFSMYGQLQQLIHGREALPSGLEHVPASRKMPQELLGIVFKLLANDNDKRALRCCTLVCRAWVPLSSPYVLETMKSMSSVFRFSSFALHARTSVRLAENVRSIELFSMSFSIRTFAFTLQHLQSIRRLILWSVELQPSWLPYASPAPWLQLDHLELHESDSAYFPLPVGNPRLIEILSWTKNVESLKYTGVSTGLPKSLAAFGVRTLVKSLQIELGTFVVEEIINPAATTTVVLRPKRNADRARVILQAQAVLDYFPSNLDVFSLEVHIGYQESDEYLNALTYPLVSNGPLTFGHNAHSLRNVSFTLRVPPLAFLHTEICSAWTILLSDMTSCGKLETLHLTLGVSAIHGFEESHRWDALLDLLDGLDWSLVERMVQHTAALQIIDIDIDMPTFAAVREGQYDFTPFATACILLTSKLSEFAVSKLHIRVIQDNVYRAGSRMLYEFFGPSKHVCSVARLYFEPYVQLWAGEV